MGIGCVSHRLDTNVTSPISAQLLPSSCMHQSGETAIQPAFAGPIIIQSITPPLWPLWKRGMWIIWKHFHFPSKAYGVMARWWLPTKE